jgi:dolichol-phosphate mannosyltransferase
MRSLVIIPTYNERENLPLLIPAILRQGPHFEILVVDDNSPDGTGLLAEIMSKQNPRIQVIHRPRKLGLGTAYIEGFKRALSQDYEAIFEMDADFSHNPDKLPDLLATLEQADVVIGSRWVTGGGTENWSFLRKLVSRGGSLYARLLLNIPIKDLTGGFKCFRRSVLTALDLDSIKSNGYGFQVELNFLCHRHGFRLVEIPIIFPDRRLGRSKMSSGIVFEAARRVWQLRGRKIPSLPSQSLRRGVSFPGNFPSSESLKR